MEKYISSRRESFKAYERFDAAIAKSKCRAESLKNTPISVDNADISDITSLPTIQSGNEK